VGATEVYVYGVVRAGHRPPPGRRGVGAPPARLRVLRAGPLAAVVSSPPADLLGRRRDLLAHQETLLALAAAGPVAPMRFGVVAAAADAVTARLAGAEADYLDLLDRLDGRLEMNVKVFCAEDALPGLLREDARLRRLRDDARDRPGYQASLRLGEAAVTALRRRAAEAATGLVDLLGRLAEAAAEGPEVPGCVRNVSFLVPRARLAAFQAEAAGRAAAVGDRAQVRVSGPLPCFSFAAEPRDRAVPAAGRW
jgi:hypothetical protein